MNALLARGRPPAPALAALLLAAVAFVVGGVDHARLWHRGYAEVEVVGPLFLLNAIGTIAVMLLLAVERVRLFVLGVLVISLGSIVSILISHNGSFFGFAEGGWDTDATLIITVEIASVVLVGVAVALGAWRTADTPAAAPAGRPGPVSLALPAVATVVLLIAIAGVGMGDAPPNDPAPTGAELAVSKAAIAAGGAAVQRGKEEFEEEHCDTCHAIAAIGAKGQLGPRMDAQDDPAGEIEENITNPRRDIKRGYEGKLMPTDYAEEMTPQQISDVVAFIKAASTGREEDKGGGEKGEGGGDGDGDEG